MTLCQSIAQDSSAALAEHSGSCVSGECGVWNCWISNSQQTESEWLCCWRLWKKILCWFSSNICAYHSFICWRKQNAQKRESHCDQMLCYKKAVSSSSIPQFQTFVVQDSTWGLGGKKALKKSLWKKTSKQSSLNSCSVAAAVEMHSFHQALMVQVWSSGGMEGHHPGDTRQGSHERPLWHRWGGAALGQSSTVTACAHPTTPAGPAARTSPAHPHQDTCRCLSKPGCELWLPTPCVTHWDGAGDATKHFSSQGLQNWTLLV